MLLILVHHVRVSKSSVSNWQSQFDLVIIGLFLNYFSINEILFLRSAL